MINISIQLAEFKMQSTIIRFLLGLKRNVVSSLNKDSQFIVLTSWKFGEYVCEYKISNV